MVWRPMQRRSGIYTQLLVGLWIVGAMIFCAWLVQRRQVPEVLRYGVSFSKLHSDELGIDWKEAYVAILDDLNVKALRLSAHWPMIEPERDQYDFSAMDFQMNEARVRNASVILAIGKKAPGWPECHVPQWVGYMGPEEFHGEIQQYLTQVVERYKDYPNLKYWQVENEPFLNFARHICGDPDENFVREEIALVRALDPGHDIITTDGGEFGLWYKARALGDHFGSTLYVYVYTQHIGYWRYPINAAFFRAKQNIIDAFFGEKNSILIELGLEPWLQQPIAQTSLDEQLERMSMDRFEEILSLASRTGFAEQYLWGAEWWYYLEQNGHPEYWDRAKELFPRK